MTVHFEYGAAHPTHLSHLPRDVAPLASLVVTDANATQLVAEVPRHIERLVDDQLPSLVDEFHSADRVVTRAHLSQPVVEICHPLELRSDDHLTGLVDEAPLAGLVVANANGSQSFVEVLSRIKPRQAGDHASLIDKAPSACLDDHRQPVSEALRLIKLRCNEQRTRPVDEAIFA